MQEINFEKQKSPIWVFWLVSCELQHQISSQSVKVSYPIDMLKKTHSCRNKEGFFCFQSFANISCSWVTTCQVLSTLWKTGNAYSEHRSRVLGDSWKNMFCGRLSCHCAQLSFSQFRMLVRRRNSRHRKVLVAPSRSTPTNPKEAELVNGCWRVSSQECSYHKPWFFCWDFFLHALSNSLIF